MSGVFQASSTALPLSAIGHYVAKGNYFSRILVPSADTVSAQHVLLIFSQQRYVISWSCPHSIQYVGCTFVDIVFQTLHTCCIDLHDWFCLSWKLKHTCKHQIWTVLLSFCYWSWQHSLPKFASEHLNKKCNTLNLRCLLFFLTAIWALQQQTDN